MSDPASRPAWLRVPLGTIIALVGMLATGGMFLFGQIEGVHDIGIGVKELTSRMDEFAKWRDTMEAQRADRYLELKLAIGSLTGKVEIVGQQVDAIREQQKQGVEAVQQTERNIDAIARAVGAQQEARKPR